MACTSECVFLDLAQQAEYLLAGTAQNDLFTHLERGDECLRLHHFRLAQTLKRLRFSPALLKDLPILRLQFDAYELDHRQASDQIDRWIAVKLCAIQDRKMDRDQLSFEVRRVGLAQVRGGLRSANELAMSRCGNVHFVYRFDFIK